MPRSRSRLVSSTVARTDGRTASDSVVHSQKQLLRGFSANTNYSSAAIAPRLEPAEQQRDAGGRTPAGGARLFPSTVFV
ncbi:hypothetical protein F2P81_017808 [Scophthalmus maximus]|uniref:Uncharacterized protein n=1 Tax=Scophthalmus maximus TaxID=52904 RepID=A0A6A4S2X1_SCOMX|nr:hypothetical protein F2P81_017808 [Scophthalmus maximus]